MTKNAILSFILCITVFSGLQPAECYQQRTKKAVAMAAGGALIAAGALGISYAYKRSRNNFTVTTDSGAVAYIRSDNDMFRLGGYTSILSGSFSACDRSLIFSNTVFIGSSLNSDRRGIIVENGDHLTLRFSQLRGSIHVPQGCKAWVVIDGSSYRLNRQSAFPPG
jgi:hypothetical protein